MSPRFLSLLGFAWFALLGGCGGERENLDACATTGCADASDAGAFSCNPLTAPNVIRYVADVGNGDAIVVTDWAEGDDGPGGVEGERLYYGKPGDMVEYPVLQDASDCCEDPIQFSIDGVKAWAWFVFRPGGDSKASNLQIGATTFSLKLRTPTPTSLAGFSFTCSLIPYLGED